MSNRQGFRRQPVSMQAAQVLRATILPAPTRGLILNENYTFMKPGAAVVLDNWAPTTRSVKLRGGCIRHCVLPETTPIVSMFEYLSGNTQQIFAANSTKIYNVTTAGFPVEVASGQHSGNYAASELSNASGDHMLVVNDDGDDVLHYDGTTWTVFNAGQITGPAGTPVVAGHNLVYVWKYRDRYFFIEKNSMNAWYLSTNAFQGALSMIPLSGAATKGGKLLFGATWSLDAGDGADDKCVFFTDQGEALIFTGTNPSDAANWRQEGRYSLGHPMGMNAHVQIGGDLLVATVEGLTPMSAVITKESAQLDVAMVSFNIKPMWRDEVKNKRSWPWSIKRWDEYGGIFVTWPGGGPGNQYCAVINAATGAWCRFVGYDATCFAHILTNFYFGTQDGIIMEADKTGKDDGKPYTATMVGGWEMFQAAPSSIVWRQARAAFTARSGEPFRPTLSAVTDYVVELSAPPSAAPDPGPQDVWDEGLWDDALWDQPSLGEPVIRNTMWVSIGSVGFSHAPVAQVTISQQQKPEVELISIAATYEALGVNV